MKLVVLGGGMIGSAMALDLKQDKDISVTVVDNNPKTLHRLHDEYGLETKQTDLSNINNIPKVIADADLVIGAVPGYMGYNTLKKIIESGKNVVDISFFPEDPFGLDQLAKEKGVTAVIDCGIAPGGSNILIGYITQKLDQLEMAKIYVGGLPVYRQWPYEYRVVFSPLDVIEEYTRPARFVEYGQLVTQPALSEPEMIDFPEIGTLEAFNTDGLRTLIHTVKAPFLKEKTLRYPGHIEKMRMLRETGFFNKKPIDINGAPVVPLEFTAKLLFPKWYMDKDEEDITVMRIVAEGTKEGKKLIYSFDMLDRFDRTNKITSMARTTGYTATVVARLILKGHYSTKGIIPPEYLGMDENSYQFIMEGLQHRNIYFEALIEEVEK